MTSTKQCSVAAANSESSQNNRVSDCPLRMAFHQTSHPDLTRVTCELHEGLAMLHGTVSTFYLKQLAQEIAKKIDGVKLVVSKVDVAHSKQSDDILEY
jgi:osmotically-inducible protein OsmY